jgi:plasmid stability protein
MDVSNLVSEFVNLQVRAAALSPDEQDRREILRQALRLAEISAPPPLGVGAPGGSRLRFHDGTAAREIRLDPITQPVIEVGLTGAGAGDRLAVVIEPAPGSPAIAVRAMVLGPAPKGTGAVRLDLGSEVVRECAAGRAKAALKLQAGRTPLPQP